MSYAIATDHSDQSAKAFVVETDSKEWTTRP